MSPRGRSGPVALSRRYRAFPTVRWYSVSASAQRCGHMYGASPVVLLYCSSLFITSCKFSGLLTTCGGQRDAFGFPTRRAEHHDQALRLQATQTVTDGTLGTGQRCHQRRVTTREHATSPLCIGR